MKARLPKESELVLLYGFTPDSEQLAAVRAATQSLMIPHRILGVQDLGRTLAALANDTGTEPQSIPRTEGVPSGELLLMKGLSSERIDALLLALRESGAAPIARKATYTPTNSRWTLGALFTEITRESQVMGAYQRLRRLVGATLALTPPLVSTSLWETLTKELAAAQTLLSTLEEGEDEPTPEPLNTQADRLEKALAAYEA